MRCDGPLDMPKPSGLPLGPVHDTPRQPDRVCGTRTSAPWLACTPSTAHPLLAVTNKSVTVSADRKCLPREIVEDTTAWGSRLNRDLILLAENPVDNPVDGNLR